MSDLYALGASILYRGTVVNLSLTDQHLALRLAPPKQSDESKQLHLSRAEAKRQRRAQRNLRAQS